MTLSPFSLVPILIHRCMRSVEDSARPHSREDEEEVLLGTVEESKAPNAKGPTVGPSTSKRMRSEQNENEQEADALKKNAPNKSLNDALATFSAFKVTHSARGGNKMAHELAVEARVRGDHTFIA